MINLHKSIDKMHFRKGFREKFSEKIYVLFFESILYCVEQERKHGYGFHLGNNLTWRTIRKILNIIPTEEIELDRYFFRSPQISLNLILKIIKNNKFKFSPEGLFCNRYLTPEFVEKHLMEVLGQTELETAIWFLAHNKHFYFEDLQKLAPNINPVRYVGTSRNINQEIIDKYSHNDQFMSNLSVNPAISFEYILSHPEMNWTETINYRKDIKIEYVLNYPKLPWVFCDLTKNIPYSEVKKYPEFRLKGSEFLYDPTLSEEDKESSWILSSFDKETYGYDFLNEDFSFKEALEIDFQLSYETFATKFTTEKKISQKYFYTGHKLKNICDIIF